MSGQTLSGSCACGDVTYTATAAPQHLDFCYCTVCQQISGAPFVAWTGIPKSCLTIKFASEPLVYRAEIGDTGQCVAERTSCGRCSSSLILQYYLYPDKTHIAASTIHRSEFEIPAVGCHIWYRSAPAWYHLPDDGIARYAEFDPVFQQRLDDYLKENRSPV